MYGEEDSITELIHKKGRAGHLEMTSFIKWQAVRFCIRIKLVGVVKQHRIFCSSIKSAVNNHFVRILFKHGLNQVERTDALWRIRIRTKINLDKFLFGHSFCFLCNSCVSVLFFSTGLRYEGYSYHMKRLSVECRSPLPNLDLSLNYLVHTLLYLILLKLVSKTETFCILDFRVVSYMRKFQSLF